MTKPLTIGIVMDFFHPRMIEGAGAFVREHGHRLDARWSVRADWMPNQPEWDGVLAHMTDMVAAYERVQALKVPVVHLKGWLGKLALPRVDTDFAQCGKLAVEEFHRMGLERLAVVGGGSVAIDYRSRRGARAAARRLGMQCKILERWKPTDSWQEHLSGIARQLEQLEKPCGFFYPHAGVVYSLLDELETSGIRVPADLAIVVIDKDVQRTSELAPIPLTGVSIDDWQQGYEAAALLIRMLQGKTVGPLIRRIAPLGITRRESTGGQNEHDPMVAKALHLINKSRPGELRVSDLAERTGLSRRTLESKFRRVTGGTLHQALTQRRMDEARRLLRSSEQPIASIAEQCGFSSVHYFTTAFRREVGETPAAYRLQDHQA